MIPKEAFILGDNEADDDGDFIDIGDDYISFEDGDGDDWDDDDWSDGPLVCGPWCGECWGGDGICMREIEALAEEGEDYEENHVQYDVACPVCKAKLTQYDVLADDLWLWPGDWYSPMIALNVYAVYDAPKGEIHRSNGICHIWIGEGEYRREQLIRLIMEDVTHVNSSNQDASRAC